MASFKFFVFLAIMGLVYKIIRSVLANSDVLEQGRKALGLPEEKPAPATRRAPPAAPGKAPRHSAPGARVTPIAVKSSRAAARRGGNSLDDWYFVLDVSPDAGRREINEALKLRLERARAEGDTAAVRRLMQAAAIGIRQPRRAEPPSQRPRDAVAAR